MLERVRTCDAGHAAELMADATPLRPSRPARPLRNLRPASTLLSLYRLLVVQSPYAVLLFPSDREPAYRLIAALGTEIIKTNVYY